MLLLFLTLIAKAEDIDSGFVDSGIQQEQIINPVSDAIVYRFLTACIMSGFVGLLIGAVMSSKIRKYLHIRSDEEIKIFLENVDLKYDNASLQNQINFLRNQKKAELSNKMLMFIIKRCHPDLNQKDPVMANQVTQWALTEKKARKQM